MVAAIESVGDPEQCGQLADDHRFAHGQTLHAWMRPIRSAAAVEPCDASADVPLPRGENRKVRVLDQIAGVFVMRLWADGAADVVQQSRDLEQRPRRRR